MSINHKYLAWAASIVVATPWIACAQTAQPQQAPPQQAQPRQVPPGQGQFQPPQQPPAKVVATVNGDPITQREVDITVQQQMQQLQGQNPQPLGPEVAQQIEPKAVETLIESRLVEQYAVDKGPGVTKDEIAASVNRLKKQLSEQGGSFEQFLMTRGQTEKAFTNRVKGSIAWHKLQQQEVTEEKLQSFFEENQDRFNAESLEQARPKVAGAYVEQLWDKIVAETKPKAEIKSAKRGSERRPQNPVPLPR